nr:translin associated factor X interacting protein [Hymenolepis microstoma]
MQLKLHEKLKELSIELLRESDARKLAIMDLSQLQTEYRDLLKYSKELSVSENGDAVTLKIALTQANEAHTKALNRIVYLETEYSDVVPKKEFEKIQNNLNETETLFGKLQERLNQFEAELASKRDEISSLLNERNELNETLESLQRVSTPRPEWPRVASLVPGGRKRWQQLTTGMSSKEKLVIFSSELTGGGPQASILQSQIGGLSSEEGQKKVPKFLEGCLLMTPHIKPKRDLLLLLEDIWLGRQKQLAEYLKDLGKGKRSKLPRFNEFLSKYLKNAFGVENIRKEWSLSIYLAGSLMTECGDIVRFRKIIDNEVDEAYHWYLHSLTGRLFNQLRELANAIAIALTMSQEPTEEKNNPQEAQNTESQLKSTGCRLTTYQLSLVLAKLLDCEPQNPSVIRLVQAALVSNNEEWEDEESFAMAAIPMDDVVCLEDLFHQAPGEPLAHFAHALVCYFEQGRKAIIDHIIVEIQRQKSRDGASVMVTPNDVLEAMKIVRPELESIIGSSPNCFFLLDQRQESDKGRGTLRGDEYDLTVCDLDETCATREEQALAWSRCAAANEEGRNYLVSTVHWLFQKDESYGPVDEKELPLEVIERRLRGANIKPYNKLTAVT